MPKQLSASATSDVAVIYCRVSSDRQAKEDKDSLDAQERNGLTKARELALPVLYVRKHAESAWILDKRSEFQQVLADARAGKFNVLIVDRMNRLTRSEDLGEYMALMTELTKAGARVVFSTRDYDRDERTGHVTPLGQVTQFLDAYVSSQEQANRRKQCLVGKRARVQQRQQPTPGSWPPYGYIWTDARKTQLAFDTGDSQRIMRRIWRHFLTDAHPTLAGMAKTLNTEGTLTPREYRGVKRGRNAVASGPRWTAETVRSLLRNPLYWGGNANGFVPAFHYSKYSDETLIPAYAPPYVSRDEAARVHARLAANKAHATRNRRHDRDTLLHAGIARCGYCGWGLTPHTFKKQRLDGSVLTTYRCNQSAIHGKQVCKGVSISAEALDLAVLTALDERIQHGDFLRRIFDAWEANAESALGDTRALEQTLSDARQQVDNAMKRLATYAPDDPLAAPLEAHARMLAETLPSLEARLERARAALGEARNNATLRDDLARWFATWLDGVWLLSRDDQRAFLMALGATVTVYRADDRSPQAVLELKLPTSALRLPPAPNTPDSWQLEVDTEDAAQRIADARGFAPYGTTPAAPAPDAETQMRELAQTLQQRGYRAAARRAKRAIVSSPA